jgi:multidrug efflux pump subunit AcrA (membrane-fusion protein)
LLKTSLVRPGDLVAEGEVVARMDDRELRWELSKAVAQWGRAAKMRDVAMAAHDTPEKQMAELEMQRLEQQIELLQSRQQNLEITSPLGGVVLKGDLEDAEGAPVKVGQALFEIAPLDPVKMELSIREQDLPAVQQGQRILARLEGCRGSIQGVITRIYPQSEIIDARNVFLAEVELENSDGRFRPGMSGTARVAAGLRPLGWIWFHKAWHRLMVFLGV